MLWRPYTFIVVIIAALISSLVFINSRYQNVKQNYQTLKQQYDVQIEAVKLQQQKIDALHQLDIQQTEKLNNAKAEIAKLCVLALSGCASTPCVQYPKPLPPRADMMKPPHNLVRLLDKIISVSER